MIVVATTPVGTLSYLFELEFTPGNWLNVHDTSNTWVPAAGTEDFSWRVTVTASDGTNPDDVEVYTPAGPVELPATGVLQTMTWTLTAVDSGTVGSSGLEIIDSAKTNQLEVNGGPRFWNGTEANNNGATNKAFATSQDNRDWWYTYQGRIRQNGRDWMQMDHYEVSSFQDKMEFDGTSANYNNVGNTRQWMNSTYGPAWWLTQATGQVIDIELYTQGQVPDNWYTYQEGAGVAPGYGNFPLTPVLDAQFPLDANTFGPGCQFLGYTTSAVSLFSTPANKDKMPEYFGVYITAAEAAAGTYGHADTEGWYVFGPKIDDSPGVNGYCNFAPYAWPTGGSDGTNGGLWNNGSTYDVGVVYLSDYTGATGNGGTDGWSAPIGSLL